MTSRGLHVFAQSNGPGRGLTVVTEKIELNVSGGTDEGTWKKRSDELMAQMMDKIADLVDQPQRSPDYRTLFVIVYQVYDREFFQKARLPAQEVWP